MVAIILGISYSLRGLGLLMDGLKIIGAGASLHHGTRPFFPCGSNRQRSPLTCC